MARFVIAVPRELPNPVASIEVVKSVQSPRRLASTPTENDGLPRRPPALTIFAHIPWFTDTRNHMLSLPYLNSFADSFVCTKYIWRFVILITGGGKGVFSAVNASGCTPLTKPV